MLLVLKVSLHAHVLSFLSAFPLPSPNSSFLSPFPSLPFRSFPLPFVPFSRFVHPAQFRLSSPLPFSSSVSRSPCHSVCLSVALFLCFSVSLSLFSLTYAFPRPAWFPSVPRFVSLSLSASFPMSPSLSLQLPLCRCLYVSVSLSLYVLSLYSFAPSALDPLNPGREKKTHGRLGGVFCLLKDSFFPSALNPQNPGREKAQLGRLGSFLPPSTVCPSFSPRTQR